MALRLPYSVVSSGLVPASLDPLFWREFEVVGDTTVKLSRFKVTWRLIQVI
jgi:hypothetical protein